MTSTSDAPRDEQTAWTDHSRQRERSQTRLFMLLATALVPAWIPFDWLLEPQLAPQFMALRLADVCVGLALLFALSRARTLRVVRMLAVLKLVSTAGAIALMLPLVTEFYWLYLLGFSLIFWGTAVILALPSYVLAAAWGLMISVAAGAMVLFPTQRSMEEIVGGGFFLVTMVIICVAQVALRERLERQAFLSTHRLAAASRKVFESEELKTQFFANVSHELRTPLALILGPAERLAAAPGLSGDQHSALKLIVRNAQLLLGHVNNLLDVTRLEVGEFTIHHRQLDLARFVRDLAAHFDGLAQERGVAYVVETPEDLPAEADPGKLQSVVLNLLSNAFKVTPPGGRIRCTLTARGAHAVLEVADSGPGIRPEDRALVFERFRQVDGGTTRSLGGTGLGLAIVKDLVQLHRGQVFVGDAAEGGASFRVDLPLRAPSGVKVRPADEQDERMRDAVTQRVLAELQPVQSAVMPDAAGSAPLVLVVEDNPELNRFVRESLSPVFRTASAPNGRSGLALALELRPDLMVTDIMMPEMSGEQLVEAMRAHHELDDVPILILSARADDELRVRLLRQGAQDYLTKPFSAAELRARASNLIGMRRARLLLQADLQSQDQDLERLAREVTIQKNDLHRALESTRVARDLAEQASELKTNFLRLVSHELRSPLTTLLLLIQRLERPIGDPLPADKQVVIARLARSALRLRDMVEGLLEYSRMQSGKLQIEVEKFDFLTLCHEVLEDVRPQAQAKGLALELEPPSVPLPELSSDPRIVRLILVNLLGNAIKFTEAGQIALRVTWKNELHSVSVQDTGPGIPAEQRTRIFEPFEQLESTRRKHIAGVGLGLALVRDMVAALDGSIELSASNKQGSTFTVWLPHASEHRRAEGSHGEYRVASGR